MHAVAIHIVSDTFLPLMISGVLAYTAMNVRLEKKHAGIALKAVALVAMHACFIWGFSKIRHSLSGFPEIAGQDNAAALADALMRRGFSIVSGGTDNHSMLVDLRTKYPDLTGKVAEKALVAADITVNKNMVPFDTRSAFQTSGIRLGTPAITTRGAKEGLMGDIAEMIETVLSNVGDEGVIASVRRRVNDTMRDYPIFAY